MQLVLEHNLIMNHTYCGIGLHVVLYSFCAIAQGLIVQTYWSN